MQRLVVIDRPLTQNKSVLVLLPQYTTRIQVQCRDATAILMAHRKDAVDTSTPVDYFTIKSGTVWSEEIKVGSGKESAIYLSCASASKVAEITCIVGEEDATE